MLGWPSDEETMVLGSVQTREDTTIEMLGYDSGNLTYKQLQDGSLKVDLPPFFKVIKGCPSCLWASVLKFTNVNPTLKETLLEEEFGIEE